MSDWTILTLDSDEIKSVRRTSDGEVFSIGDKVIYDFQKHNPEKALGKIDRIWVSFEQLRIDIGNCGDVLASSDGRKDIIKA